jgi:hypothetical protein
MKRLFVAAVFAFTALILVAPQHAHAFGIMGSWWNLKDTDHDGWGGGIRQEIPLIPPGHEAGNSLVHLSLDTRASYLHFKDANLNMFPLELGALLGLGVIYAEGGGGYYIMDTTGNAPSVDNNWGWYVLGGVMLGKGAKGLFGEVKYTKLSADIKNVDPDLGDVPHTLNADGVGVNVGISFGI